MEKAQTVERALRILRCFSEEQPELTASEFVRHLALPRTIVVRLLGTLEAAGFLERNARDSRYRIGLAAFEIGSLYVAANPLLGFINRELARLAEETGYTAYFGVLEGAETIIIAHHEGRLPVRFIWSAGDRLPVTTTGLGKAMLAHLSPKRLDALLGESKLSGLTEHSLSNRRQLDAQLAEVRKRGYAVARDESSLGITAVGAAILDADAQPIGGISLSILDYPRDARRVERAGTIIRQAAATINGRAGVYESYAHRLSPAAPTTNLPARTT
ncbi:MAG: IclR family transcriptional regulator [bacterium]|nr:IclR family transcriptional regulator [bacterium]